MPNTPPPAPQNSALQNSGSVREIWKYLKRPQDLDEVHEWPFVDIRAHKDDSIPAVSDAAPIPDGLVHAFGYDFRMFSTPIECSEHFSFFLGCSQVEVMTEFWRGILQHILTAFGKCPRPRTRNGMSQVIIDNLHGLHGIDDDNETDENRSKEEEARQQNRSSLDLNNSIRVMTSIFGPSERLTGEEDESFLHRLQPTIDQMLASNIPAEHRVTTFFSVLTDKASQAASKIRMHNISVVEFVQKLSNTLVYEHNVQQLKINRWKAITFSEFRNKTQTHHQAVRECIDFLKSHQKDLSNHLKTDQQLFGRLRDVFEFQDWCSTLYEQDLPTMTPEAFSHRLLTAASRYDSRQKRAPVTTTPPIQLDKITSPLQPFISSQPLQILIRQLLHFNTFLQRSLLSSPKPRRLHVTDVRSDSVINPDSATGDFVPLMHFANRIHVCAVDVNNLDISFATVLRSPNT